MWSKKAAWLACAWLMATAMLLAAVPARAQGTQIDVQQMQLDWTEGGVFLSANLKFDLSAPVEDALRKGIPMYFVAEAELFRDRWYWADQKLSTEARHMRLSFQPLTRRWRLNVAPTPIGNSGLGVTLNQSFDSLSDAMAAVQRFARWKIADVAEVEPDSRLHVEFSFRLDVSQLPRPFQIGAVGQSDWNLSVNRSFRLVFEGGTK
ncbi:DUF4390 domain-containing protein [Rhodoferax koreensis]|uniref:DUF4390 domain-containing protein n=1 Tax=Rhodoferax koreensis TaxID=1842727 RepID=UPI001EF68016|nr:DUF4390 domain-containing protein [Rhodoferax koreense]